MCERPVCHPQVDRCLDKGYGACCCDFCRLCNERNDDTCWRYFLLVIKLSLMVLARAPDDTTLLSELLPGSRRLKQQHGHVPLSDTKALPSSTRFLLERASPLGWYTLSLETRCCSHQLHIMCTMHTNKHVVPPTTANYHPTTQPTARRWLKGRASNASPRAKLQIQTRATAQTQHRFGGYAISTSSGTEKNHFFFRKARPVHACKKLPLLELPGTNGECLSWRRRCGTDDDD